MIRRIVAAVIAFSVLMFVYALYLAAFRRVWGLPELNPELLPRPNKAAQWRQLAEDTDIAHRVAVETFGDDAWQANAVISLYWADQDIFLYANRYEFPTKKTMVLAPVSIVRLAEQGNKQRESYVLSAGRAQLQFERPISLANFSEVRPLIARAEQDVRIAWNRGTEDPADDVYVQLDNITYHRKRKLVWTTGHVRITADQMVLEGEDGRVTLREEDSGLQVESLQLARKVRLDALVDRVAQAVLGKQAAPADDRQRQAVRITCTGPLVVQAKDLTAAFHKEVRVTLQAPEGQPDTLTADELRVSFERTARAAGAREQRGAGPRLGLKQVLALGQPVTVHSPSRKLQAVATRLVYDHQSRHVQLAGDTQVQARYDRFQLLAAQLELTFLPQNRFKAIVPGPGRLTTADTNGPGTTASWQKRAMLDTDGQQQVAVLQGSVQVEQGGRGKLTASDAVRLWFDPERPGPQADGQLKGAALPTRIEASGRVVLSSPTLTLTTQLLSATVEPLVAAPVSDQARTRGPWFFAAWRDGPAVKVKGVRPVAAEPDPVPAVPAPPVDARPAEDNSKEHNKGQQGKKAQKHVAIEAREIKVALVVDGERTEAREVWARGAVEVIQTLERKPQTRITADTVHVKTLQRGHFFEVNGKLASIEASGLTIRGARIGFDQPTQVAWVQGAGEMQLQAAVPLAGDQSAQEGKPIHIAWQHEMFFDGLVAEFVSEVEVRQADMSIRCDKLEVFLSQRVSLTDGDADTRKVELAKLVATKSVQLRTESQTGRTVIECPRLVYDQKEHRIVIAGPGKFWLANFGSPSPLVARDESSAAAQWTGTLALFDRMMEIERQGKKLVRFIGRVRVWHAPIEGPEQTFSHVKPPQNAIFVGCDQLELLSGGQDGTGLAGGGQIEQFIARGNARVEGRGFYAHADVLKYDAVSPNPKLVAEATGTGLATFYRQKAPGRRPDVLRARKVYYWPRTGEFRQEGGIMLDVRGNPSLPQRR